MGDDMLAIWHENDRYSFEDSDRFEEDSLCTWSSEPESACINWRGWRKPTEQNTEDGQYFIFFFLSLHIFNCFIA